MAGIKRTREFYLRALRGTQDKDGEMLSPGLRDVASGFDAKHGYRLADFDEWTPAQKAKITKYHNELQRMTAQPWTIHHERSSTKREKMNEVLGYDTGYKFKVVILPYVKKVDKRGREVKPKVSLTKQGAVRVGNKWYNKVSVQLNQVALARNSKAEVARVLEAVPDAQRFTILTNPHNEMPGLYDRSLIADRVRQLMLKYDGIKPLPRGSGNAGDSPKHHKWTLWMHGLVGYEFPNLRGKTIAGAVTDFDAAKRELQRRRRAERKRLAYQRSKQH